MRIHSLSAVAAAVASTLLLASCGGGGSGGTQTAVVTPQPVQVLQNARYQVVFRDAVSGATITDPLKATFVAQAPLKAADGSSLNNATVTTSTGLVFVSADFTAAANDFSVQVADAGGKGWVANGMRVVGSAGLTGDQQVEIRMVNTKQSAAVNASTEAVAMAVSTATVSATGATAAAIVVTTPPKTVTNDQGASQAIGTASVAMPAGTIGKTASGATAAPGPLTVSNSYFSNATADSLAAFPGGFAATVQVPPESAAVLNGVAPNAGSFVTAGFAQFNVTDSQGNQIKTFDKPLTLGIDIPKTTLNANGTPVTAGSTYPVWSYDDAAGTWKFEKLGTVTEKSPVDPANFSVQFTTTHLSSWNAAEYVDSCDATVNLVGRPDGDTRTLGVQVIGDLAGYRSPNYAVQGASQVFKRVPNFTGTVVVKDRGFEVGRVSGKNLCAAPITVPVTLQPGTFGKVRVETSEACADGSKQRALSAPTIVIFDKLSKATVGYGGYPTQRSTTDNFAQFSWASIPTGTIDVTAQNPRTGLYVGTTDITRGGVTTTSTVVDGDTTVFRFHFPMQCQQATGASSN